MSCQNNKIPGKVKISAELIKSAPDIAYEQIAKMYSNVAKTGEYRNEITHDTLKPLLHAKSWTLQGPPSNLRLIILLSIVKRILPVCINRSIGHRLDAEIPPTEAAYRKFRSTKVVLAGTISKQTMKQHISFYSI